MSTASLRSTVARLLEQSGMPAYYSDRGGLKRRLKDDIEQLLG
ncbi:MAG TPA: hypothetical protein VMV94_08260 [Phycisphaerae bacterium]|nr:hypothetical protein [Phycisphaerae bacterium]